MIKAVSAIAALLLAAAILLTGNGLQGTLLAVRAELEGFPAALIGALMACYFAGFILGCRINPRFIASVGHIRTFVALASIASSATLLHVLIVDVYAWGVLRAITGFCFAGLIMIIESWLNERADNSNRGALLSVYRVVDLSATMIGNALLAVADPRGFVLFAFISILMSIALVPVALTRSAAPKPILAATLNIGGLYRLTPAAAITAPAIGLANGSFWAVGPVFAQRLGYDASVIAGFMTFTVMGAALLQWPLGYASDRVDRRIVMVASSFLGAGAALALARFGGDGVIPLYALGFTTGAFIIPLFGIAAAHANDHAAPEKAVETNASLLFIHGLGSVTGALVGGAVLSTLGPRAVFVYISGVYSVLTVILVFRILTKTAVPKDEKSPFQPIPRNAAPTIFELGEDTAETDDGDPAPQGT